MARALAGLGSLPYSPMPLFGDGSGLRSSKAPLRPVEHVRARAWTQGSGWPTRSPGLRWDSAAIPNVSSAYPYRQVRRTSYQGYQTFEYVGEHRPSEVAMATEDREEQPQPPAHRPKWPAARGSTVPREGVTLEAIASGRVQVPRGTILSNDGSSTARHQLTATRILEMALAGASEDDRDRPYASSSDDLESIGSDDELIPEPAARTHATPGAVEGSPRPSSAARAAASECGLASSQAHEAGSAHDLRIAFEERHGAAAQLATSLLGALDGQGGQRVDARCVARFGHALVAVRSNRYGAAAAGDTLRSRVVVPPPTGLRAALREGSAAAAAVGGGGVPAAEAAAPAKPAADAAGEGAPASEGVGAPLPLPADGAESLGAVRAAVQPRIELSWTPPASALADWRYELEVAALCPHRGKLAWALLRSGLSCAYAYEPESVGSWWAAPGGVVELGPIDDFAFRVRTVAPTGFSAFSAELVVRPARVRLQRVRALLPELQPAYLRRLGLLELAAGGSNGVHAQGGRVAAGLAAGAGAGAAQASLALLAVLQRWQPELRAVFREACVRWLQERQPDSTPVAAQPPGPLSLERAHFLRFVRGALDVPRRALPTHTLERILTRACGDDRARPGGDRARAAPPGADSATALLGDSSARGSRLSADEFVAALVRTADALFTAREAARHAQAARDKLGAGAEAEARAEREALLLDALAGGNAHVHFRPPTQPGGSAAAGGAEAAGLEAEPRAADASGEATLAAARRGAGDRRAAAARPADGTRAAGSGGAEGGAGVRAHGVSAQMANGEAGAEERVALEAIAFDDSSGCAAKLDLLMRLRVLPRVLLALGSEQTVDTVLHGRMALAMLRSHEQPLASLFARYAELADSLAARWPGGAQLDVRVWMALLADGGISDEAAHEPAATTEPRSGALVQRSAGRASRGAPAPRPWLPAGLALRIFADACRDAEPPSERALDERTAQHALGRAGGGAVRSADFGGMGFHRFAIAVCRVCHAKLCLLEDGAGPGSERVAQGELPRSAPTERAFVALVDELLAHFLRRYGHEPALGTAIGGAARLPIHTTLAIAGSTLGSEQGRPRSDHFEVIERGARGRGTARTESFAVVGHEPQRAATSA